MKIVILIFLGSNLLISFCTRPKETNIQQNQILKTEFSNDTIECIDISVSNIGICSSKDKLLKNFGKPDSTQEIEDDEDSPSFKYQVLNYGENEFAFYKGMLFGFDLKNSKFSFNGITVGDSINKIAKPYPNTYKKGMYKNNTEMSVNCKNTCIKCYGPQYVIFRYNDKKIIKEISALDVWK